MGTNVVAISGGKDSTAMALRLKEVEPDLNPIYLFTPTGDELPDMVAHWHRLEALLGQEFTVPSNVPTLKQLIRHMRALPNFRQRWCTRIIKIQSALAWSQGLEQPVTIIAGLRADEEDRVGIYGDAVENRYPLREWEWGISDVTCYLAQRKITIPRRTDCARCPFQRPREWYDLWRLHPDIYEDAWQDELWVSLQRGKLCTFRTPGHDKLPQDLMNLRQAFEGGVIPNTRIPFGSPEACRVCRL